MEKAAEADLPGKPKFLIYFKFDMSFFRVYLQYPVL
jgi:hypothetical protein